MRFEVDFAVRGIGDDQKPFGFIPIQSGNFLASTDTIRSEVVPLLEESRKSFAGIGEAFDEIAELCVAVDESFTTFGEKVDEQTAREAFE